MAVPQAVFHGQAPLGLGQPGDGIQDALAVLVRQGARAVAVGEGAVWILNADDKTVSKIDPRTPYPLVNLSMAYARLGDNRSAEQSLRKALNAPADETVVQVYDKTGKLLKQVTSPTTADEIVDEALSVLLRFVNLPDAWAPLDEA